MSILSSYKQCIYCGNKYMKKLKEQRIPNNFYIDAIKSDLKISNSILKR